MGLGAEEALLNGVIREDLAIKKTTEQRPGGR